MAGKEPSKEGPALSQYMQGADARLRGGAGGVVPRDGATYQANGSNAKPMAPTCAESSDPSPWMGGRAIGREDSFGGFMILEKDLA